MTETAMARRSKAQMAARVACDIADGMVVNLGIALPMLLANHLDADREPMMHSKNGVIGRTWVMMEHTTRNGELGGRAW